MNRDTDLINELQQARHAWRQRTLATEESRETKRPRKQAAVKGGG